jgi:SAM-dependent methyltransferase
MPHLERACDCCSASTWKFAFADNGYNLYRCTACGLYTVDPLPFENDRTSEMGEGFAGDREIPEADLHRRAEATRSSEFRHYVELLERHVPQGHLLDIGCGTGQLLAEAQRRRFSVTGIELARDRARIAAQRLGVDIYEQPVESLEMPAGTFDAISMINVFSHLISPRQTLGEVVRILKPGGVVLIHTGEIGPDAKKSDSRNWELGDHLHWLGPGTIERYTSALGLRVVEREEMWAPETIWNRKFFATPGRSRFRNLVKATILTVPAIFPIVRGIMLYRQRDVQSNVVTIVLAKP